MTQDDTVLGGQQGWNTHFSFGSCHTPVTTCPPLGPGALPALHFLSRLGARLH